MERQRKPPIAGQVWMKKPNQFSVVREVVSVDEKKVYYKVLHCPNSMKLKEGSCRIQSFLRDFRKIEPMKDYSLLDGAKHFETFVVLSTTGKTMFRCNEKRAKFYLKKQYAIQVDDHTLQFTNDVTEDTLNKLYDGKFSEFFMVVKNDHCACCGKKARLTRHHIVPKCHKMKLPLELRKCLSNVLFVCIECHKEYDHEWKPEEGLSWINYILAWRDHFLNTMNPMFLPKGWDIFTQPMENVKAKGF